MQVTLEHQNGEVVCYYEAKETASGIVCDMTKEEIDTIMTLHHKQI